MLGRSCRRSDSAIEPPFGNANERVVRLEVLAPRVERLICRDDREAFRVGEIEQPRLELLLFLQAVALQFDIEPVAEVRCEPRAARRRKLGLPAREREIERSAGAAGERDQPRGIPGAPQA